MTDYVWVILGIILFPFLIYTVFRIVSSAIFRSWFEQKHEFDNKKQEVVHGRKDKT